MLTLEAINYKQAHELVSKFHYLGNKRFIGQHIFGAFENEQLIGAVVYQPLAAPETPVGAFGLPRGHYPYLLEMSRLVLDSEKNGKNIGSQLVGFSLRELKKRGIKAVVSYADSSRHVGAIYQACNFTYHGMTKQKCDFVLPDGRIQQRGKTKGVEGSWVPRTRKHRYVYLLDKKMKVLWPEEPYPKRSV